MLSGLWQWQHDVLASVANVYRKNCTKAVPAEGEERAGEAAKDHLEERK